MAERRSFLLRLDPDTYAALRAWAADDLRSVNGQVEFLLRRALCEAGREPGRHGSGRGAEPGAGGAATAGQGANPERRGAAGRP